MKQNCFMKQSFFIYYFLFPNYYDTIDTYIDNSDENDSMKTLLLESTLQSTLPLIQTTQSNSDPLYISNILPGSK